MTNLRKCPLLNANASDHEHSWAEFLEFIGPARLKVPARLVSRAAQANLVPACLPRTFHRLTIRFA